MTPRMLGAFVVALLVGAPAAAAAGPTISSIKVASTAGPLRPALVTVTVKAGRRATKKTTLKLVLSRDGRLGKGDVAVGKLKLRALKRGKSATVRTFAVFPESFTAKRRVLACAGRACRASKPVTPGAARALPTAAATLDPTHAAAADLRERGGTVTATDAAGNTFTLTIPANVLVGVNRITVTPVTALNPAQGRLVAGVQLGPAGLDVGGATLEIKPAAPLKGAAAFQFDARGGAVGDLPLPVKPKAVFPIWVLRGYGLRAHAAAARASVLGRPCTGAVARAATVGLSPCSGDVVDGFLDAISRAVTDELEIEQLVKDESDSSSEALQDLSLALQNLIDLYVLPRVESWSAKGADGAFTRTNNPNAVAQIIADVRLARGISRQLQLLATTYRTADIQRAVAAALERAVEFSGQYCTDPRTAGPASVVRKLSDAYLIGLVLRMAQLEGHPPDPAELMKSGDCLRKVSFGFDSDTSGMVKIPNDFTAFVRATSSLDLPPVSSDAFLAGTTYWTASGPLTFAEKNVTNEPGSDWSAVEMTSTTGTTKPEVRVEVVNEIVCDPSIRIRPMIRMILTPLGGYFTDTEIVTRTHKLGGQAPTAVAAIGDGWRFHKLAQEKASVRYDIRIPITDDKGVQKAPGTITHREIGNWAGKPGDPQYAYAYPADWTYEANFSLTPKLISG